MAAIAVKLGKAPVPHTHANSVARDAEVRSTSSKHYQTSPTSTSTLEDLARAAQRPTQNQQQNNKNTEDESGRGCVQRRRVLSRGRRRDQSDKQCGKDARVPVSRSFESVKQAMAVCKESVHKTIHKPTAMRGCVRNILKLLSAI